jgi:stage V sporulation protein G
MSSNITLDVRAYPINEPKGNTLAFASVAFKAGGEELAAIRGIRVVDSEKGPFVSMPQSKSEKDGKTEFHDIAFPLNGDLRKELNAAVLDEAYRQAELDSGERGYAKPEPSANGGIRSEDVNLEVKIFPIKEPQGNTLAFASIGFNVGGEDIMAIRGIRVVDSEKGAFVSMPQSKDKDGEFHDVAFPLSGDLRKEVNKAVLAGYDKPPAAEKKQGLGDRLKAGAEKSAQYAASAPVQEAAAKKSPGLGD